MTTWTRPSQASRSSDPEHWDEAGGSGTALITTAATPKKTAVPIRATGPPARPTTIPASAGPKIEATM